MCRHFAELLCVHAIFRHVLRQPITAHATSHSSALQWRFLLTTGRHFSPQKIAPPLGNLHSHLINGSLGPHETPPQTHLNWFSHFSGSWMCPTDRLTNRATDHTNPCAAINHYRYMRCSLITHNITICTNSLLSSPTSFIASRGPAYFWTQALRLLYNSPVSWSKERRIGVCDVCVTCREGGVK